MRRLPVTTVAWAAFAFTSAAAIFLYPAPKPLVGLTVVDYPRVPPGTLTLEAAAAAAATAAPAELRVVRIARAGDRTVILEPESGDSTSLRLVPGSPVQVQVPVPVVVDAEEILIAALLFPDPDPAYLSEIGERQTVSPRGIAPHARAALRLSIGPRGLESRPD